MKLTELFKNDSLYLSFEVFPPKTDTAFESVKHATKEIAKLNLSFMSVIYGAGGGTGRYTLKIAQSIKNYSVPTITQKLLWKPSTLQRGYIFKSLCSQYIPQ